MATDDRTKRSSARRWQRALALVSALTLACAGAPPPAAAGPVDAAVDWAALGAARLPQLASCTPRNVPEPVLCGNLAVPEDRERPGGRMIDLAIVVVPAQRKAPQPDPVFFFEGGPGGAATARATSSIFAGPVRNRDIVLVDQRGTGGSNALECDLSGAAVGRPGEAVVIFDAAAVARCAEMLGARADLAHYTSTDHADDIEAVRLHLGYGPINARGGSYGTRAMMVYAQRYPGSVRSLFGIGVDSPLRANLAERGIVAEQALAGVAALCAADAGCAAIAPALESMVGSLLEALADGPRHVSIADPSDPGKTLTLDVSRPWLAEQLRLVLYFAFASRALPWAVHRAHDHDEWASLIALGVLIERSFQSSLAAGVLLTVQCSEGMDFELEAARMRGAQTLFGNGRLDQQVIACAAWPHTRRPPLGVEQPRVLDIPSLFLSGRLDAVTPPAYAEDAMQLFPNSRHIVLEKGQHGPFDLEGAWPCVHRVWADFLDAGSVEDLDTSCTESLVRPPFLLDAESFSVYLRETLAPMSAGS